MPPRKRTPSSGPSGSGAPEEPAPGDSPASSGSGGRGGRDGARLGRNPDADPVRIHRDYVQRRVGGGSLPTPEAYERAVDQWHRLGGAVRKPSGEIHRDAVEPDAAAAATEEGDAAPSGYDGPLPATDPGDNSAYEEGRR